MNSSHPEQIKLIAERVAQANGAGSEFLVTTGGLSKILLNDSTEPFQLSTQDLSGVVEYEPKEFTITALAGTPILELQTELDRNGQYLPFDPMWVGEGATVGGTIAAGATGSCRLRFGSIRDFVIGIQFVDGLGNVVRSGANVVKNSAGFDLSKFFVGSAGRFGVITEATFKVFPKPRVYETIIVECEGILNAVDRLKKITQSDFEFDAIDIGSRHSIFLRFGGEADAMAGQRQELRTYLDLPETDGLSGDDDNALWKNAAAAKWMLTNGCLVKVPITIKNITAVVSSLDGCDLEYRVVAGGNSILLSANNDDGISVIEELLQQHQLAGQLLVGPWSPNLIGDHQSLPFLSRVKSALDPRGVFGELSCGTVRL
jgi:glycolate oxidase FAD binding subunit